MNFNKEKQLCSFNHDKFWASLDTQKDKDILMIFEKIKNLLGIKIVDSKLCCCN